MRGVACISSQCSLQTRDYLVIVSLIEEEVWVSLLAPLPQWLPSRAPMLVVAPHPDDEILGVGGLIAAQRARDVDVSVVAVTDGENAYPEVSDTAGLGRERCREQTEALLRVGVPEEKIVRLCLPDSNVTAHLPELIDRVSSLVTPQTHLLAPWRGDFHPDHEACGIAAETVSHNTGAMLTSYFFWTWHRGTPGLIKDLPLRRFPLDSSRLSAKTEALFCHRSQLFRQRGEPILPPSLLSPAERPFEVFLAP
jgi:LmbE family N-acetylglucosaminyl deacetylase